MLFLSSLGVCVAGIEVFHRARFPHRAFGGAWELIQFRQGGRALSDLFELDPEIGFVPVRGSGVYDRFGTRVNDYPVQRRPGVERLLFLGDSVTARGRIIEALRKRYGERRYEYWNAGVESFNTVQEVAYYRRFCSALNPDHVILSFHLNDFETTPVAFVGRDGVLVVYAPNRPVRTLNRWLFVHSFTYRYWLGLTSRQKAARGDVLAEVKEALAALRDETRERGARLTVLVLPIMRPLAEWSPHERQYRGIVLSQLQDLAIRHVDLMPALDAAIAAGRPLAERDDPLGWHPSADAAGFFAAQLEREDLLDDPAAMRDLGVEGATGP